MPDLAIICPTLGRPDKLAAIVENVRSATVNPARVYFVIESTDKATIKATEPLDSIDVIGTFGSCAAAVNGGYLASEGPYFAVINDDCALHEGWDEKALAHMGGETRVVGLNDGSGDCKCFQLVERSFIEEHSGVYDRPNTVYHPYVSQCCDTEFAFYAQLRGVWADAHDAVCEHQHWRFGKADADHPNYQKAIANNEADLQTYAERRSEWDPTGATPMAVPGA